MSQYPTLPHPLRLNNLRINGIAMGNARAGEQLSVLVRVALTSDEAEFYSYMQSFSSILLKHAHESGVDLVLDRISALLLVTHSGGTADLYVQDIPMSIEILAKHDVVAGEVVYRSGVADVRRVKISGLELMPEDGVVICFKVGWKFALFFDLEPNRSLDIDKMERSLGRLYRILSFQDIYEVLSDQDLFDQLARDGWFPFIEIIGGEFEILLKAHKAGFNLDEEKVKLLKKFGAARIDTIAERWWKRPSLGGRKSILEPALDAFKRGDPVSCLKNILTEMEGIIQSVHIAELGKGASIKDLLKYAAAKGVKKADDETSLLFPKQFLQYLSDHTYASFDPKNPASEVMSRHSAGHGGAVAGAYTQERALQAILTLDQLAFYL